MLRFALGLALLILPSVALAYAPDEQVAWMDRSMTAALKDRLLEPSIWRRVTSSLDSFTPKSELPLVLKAACTVGVDSTFYRDLKVRGAIFTAPKHCAETIVWAEETKTGRNFTFKELQEKYLPIENEAEAASFLFAAGRNDNAPWYSTVIEGRYFIMADEAYCNGFAHHRRIFLVKADGTSQLEGLVQEPPPKNAKCPVEAVNPAGAHPAVKPSKPLGK